MLAKTLMVTTTLALMVSLNLAAQDNATPAPATPAPAPAPAPAAGDATAPKKAEVRPRPARTPEEMRAQLEGTRAASMAPGMFGMGFLGVNLRDLDTNHDMLIEKEEIAAAIPAIRAKIKENEDLILKTFDKNGNGVLDADEQETVKRVQEALRAMEMIRRFDTNQDGKIGDDEFAAIQKFFEEQADRTNKMMLQRYDKNNDGVLDENEIKEMKEGARDRTKMMERAREPRENRGPRKEGDAAPATAPAPTAAPPPIPEKGAQPAPAK